MPAYLYCTAKPGWFRLSLGIVGVALPAFFLTWLLIGWIGWVPPMVDLFGVVGMRTPAAFSVAGLLLAAIAFWEC